MKLKFIIAIVLFLATVIVQSCFLRDSLEVINHGAYAMGAIRYYRPAGGNSTSGIAFSFIVKGANYSPVYEDGYNRWNVPINCQNCDTGNKYMVQYDSLNPSTARMLFSYPVSDSADYKKYLTLFKTNSRDILRHKLYFQK